MDTETTTPATDIVVVDEEEGMSASELTKFALTIAATAVVVIGAPKVMRRIARKLAPYAENAAAKLEVVTETTETTETEAA